MSFNFLLFICSRIAIIAPLAAAMFVSVHIKIERPLRNAKRKQEKNTELLLEEILKMGEVSRATILEKADYDELVYKLTLKYLRQKGYDIGYNKIPRVKA